MSNCKRYLTTLVLLMFVVVGMGLVYKVSCARNEMLKLRTTELSFQGSTCELGDYNTIKIDALLESINPATTKGLRFIISSSGNELNTDLSLERVKKVVSYLKKKGITPSSVKVTVVKGATILTVRIA